KGGTKASRPVEAAKPAEDDLLKQARAKAEIDRQQKLAVEREERIRKLETQSRQLGDVIEKQLAMLRELHRDAASNGDAKALLAALAKADEQILQLEETLAFAVDNREDLQKRLAGAAQLTPSAEDIQNATQRMPEVVAAYDDFRTAGNTRERVRQTVAPD